MDSHDQPRMRSGYPRASSVYSVRASQAIDRLPNMSRFVEHNREADQEQHAIDRREALRGLAQTKRGRALGLGETLQGGHRENGGKQRVVGDGSLIGAFSFDVDSNDSQQSLRIVHLPQEKGDVVARFSFELSPDDHYQSGCVVDVQQRPMRGSTRKGRMSSVESQFGRVVSRGGKRPSDLFPHHPARQSPAFSKLHTEHSRVPHRSSRRDEATQTDFANELRPKGPPATPDIQFRRRFSTIAVTKSRFVYAEPETDVRPVRRLSLIRRLSDTVKGALNRRRPSIDKRDISRPLPLQCRDEVKPQGAETQNLNAKPQHRDHRRVYQSDRPAGSAENMLSELPFRDLEGCVQRSQASMKQRERPAPASSLRIVVPSRPGRGTVYADFIDAATKVSGGQSRGAAGSAAEVGCSKKKDKPLPSVPVHDRFARLDARRDAGRNQGREPYFPGFLTQRSDTRKRIDTKTKSWMPPEPHQALLRWESERRGARCDPPNVDEMLASKGPKRSMSSESIDPIDEIIDAYFIPKAEKARFERGFFDMGKVAENIGEEEEGEVEELIVDTYDYGSHVIWVGSTRADPEAGPGRDRGFEGFGRAFCEEHFRGGMF